MNRFRILVAKLKRVLIKATEVRRRKVFAVPFLNTTDSPRHDGRATIRKFEFMGRNNEIHLCKVPLLVLRRMEKK